MKILCIDDHADNLTALKAILADVFPHARVLTALDGRAGMALALSEHPEVILLDIVMPEMDGFEVCRRLKRDASTRHIPVVFLTALRTDRRSRVEALDAGADGFLSKPVDEAELSAQVRAMARLHEAGRLKIMERESLDRLVAERTLQLKEELAERERVQEALLKSEERFRQYFENAPVYSYMVSKDGTLLDINPAAVRALGYGTRDELVGKPLVETLYAPGSRDAARALFQKWLATGRLENEELAIVTKGGEERTVLLQAEAVRGSDGNITHSVSFQTDITERKRGEETLRDSEELFKTVFAQAAVGVAQVRPDGSFVRVNRRFSEIVGYSRESLEAMNFRDITHPEDLHLDDALIARVRNGEGDAFEIEKRYLHKDGHSVWIRLYSNVVRDAWGEVKYAIATIADISERKRAEEETRRLQQSLNQAQKMEAVGRLAGGVAHDFNNMLGVILGHAEIALHELEQGLEVRNRIVQIQKTALRSTDLVRQLLAFARKQTVAPRVLDLNDTLVGMLKMLRRLIGEDMDLVWRPGARLWPVRMDPSQIDQILVNLTVNARDAIKNVGRVEIETRNLRIPGEGRGEGIPPGEYVLLTVRDNGCGMGEEVLANLFEPFFTTKEPGRGTGLGLATVYGIVRQNGGWILVESAPGKGAVFRIYLPRHTGVVPGSEKARDEGPIEGGTETVLLVEDEPGLLEMGKDMLERFGYRVLAARGPEEAMTLAEAHAGELHLLMTDVIMPGMNGRDLAEWLLGRFPALRCLFMSGYTADVIADHGVLEEGVHFIQKPFSLKTLAGKVREALKGGKA